MNEVDRAHINSAIDHIKRSGEHLISTLERSNSDGRLLESVKELQSQIMSNSNIVTPAMVARRLGVAVRTAQAWAAGARRPEKPGDVVRAIIAIATRLGSGCRPASTFEPRKSAVNCRAAPLRCKPLSSSLRRRSAERHGGVRALAGANTALGATKRLVRRLSLHLSLLSGSAILADPVRRTASDTKKSVQASVGAVFLGSFEVLMS
jgi:DNA-binding transcriptional regulator YiaG